MSGKFYLFLFLLFAFWQGIAQDKPVYMTGKAFATIFANYHHGIAGTAKEEAAFELVRGYLGYEYSFSKEFYAKINLDVGSPNDVSPYSKLRRYAYFKNAFLRYSKNKLELEFGLISLKQFKLQEEIWERRYLMKTLADEYKMGTSADLGANLNYKFNPYVDVDLTMMNGEGYSNVQMDNIFKYSVGTTLRLPSHLIGRVVYDFTVKDINESTFLLFTSYDHNKKWNLSGEVIWRQNNGWSKGHNILGMSFYGKYNLNNSYQLFARYDRISSVILEGEANPWHLAEDGSAIKAGIQFIPVKNIKMALDYQDWVPWAANREKKAYVYLDLEIKM